MNYSFVGCHFSCSVQRGACSNHGLTNRSWSAVGRSDEFLTCQKCQSAVVRLSQSWSRATNWFPKIRGFFFLPLLLRERGNRASKCAIETWRVIWAENMLAGHSCWASAAWSYFFCWFSLLVWWCCWKWEGATNVEISHLQKCNLQDNLQKLNI